MGSGTNRRPSDSPIIRTPKKAGGTGGSGDGGRDAADRVADVCLPSFEVKIKEHALVKKDQTVTLSKDGTLYAVLILSEKIGSLDDKLSKMVDECGEMGVKYTGKVVMKEGKPYARFFRKM